MLLSDYPAILVAVIYVVLVGMTENKEYYRAAVLEHVRFGDICHTKEETVKMNLQAYETAARTASNDGADIIVFPEWGLYPHDKKNRSFTAEYAEDIPDPKVTFANPCEQTKLFTNRPILKKLSCLAKENRIFLVANMADFKKCLNPLYCDGSDANHCKEKITACPDDGMYLHNTNVVFNRDGTLIARYYKRHLFFEVDMNPLEDPEDAYFDTDFGQFTTFVCFDLVFKESVHAVEKSGVLNVAYPTYWFDHLPLMYFASPYQQAWAMVNNVNLLASNCHRAGTGTMGSGIYSGSLGALIYTHNPDGRSKLLISNVPNVAIEEMEEPLEFNAKRFVIDGEVAVEEKGEEESHFKNSECKLDVLGSPTDYMSDYRCFSMNTTDYKFIKLTKPEDDIQSCAHNICCHLSYKVANMSEDYFLGIYGRKLHIFNTWSYGTEGCFLTRCDSLGSQECKNYVLKSNTIFEYVDVRGNLSAKHVFPYAINSDIRLTDKKQWSLKGKSQITYKNLDGNSSLLFLGLYGRHYDQDEALNL